MAIAELCIQPSRSSLSPIEMVEPLELVAAIYYTLIESAKAEGVSPRAYLVEAVRAARAGFALTPAGYRAYLEQALQTVAEPASGFDPPLG